MPAAANSKIRIRMYNVGFGDCFLLSLPTGSEKILKIVIDCGSLKSKNKTIREISDALIDDCRDQDGVSRIDILIMSHRHADHITGFTNPRWSDVEVGEVWMPWLESRDEPAARTIRRHQQLRAAALETAVAQLNLDQDLAIVALNARSNDEALDVLHDGFAKKVKPRFFPAGNSVVEQITSPLLDGIEVFVLGPPHNQRALNDPDPPEDQRLLTGFNVGNDETDDSDKFRPFGRDWIDEGAAWLSDHDEIREAVSQQSLYELMAAKLDAEINNTSLILIFRIGDDYLLFPGDAQWGPWELILADDKAKDLLSKITFLKVGHHASHNATPASLLREHLGRKNKRNKIVHAMISVTPYSKWKNIPHRPLITELDQRAFPYVISDDLADKVGFVRNGDTWFDFSFE
jgi:beta-lactamase superfamily II metal-dependent hydrolase